MGRGRGPVCSWLWPMERSPQVTAQAAVDTPGVGPQERGDPVSLGDALLLEPLDGEALVARQHLEVGDLLLQNGDSVTILVGGVL